ncbi:hypothetical protein H9L39_17100 [Fusarium oxysporum f. sp. albedinis]|nr:hypothetical protein H9L39_17100 [Fusarium oxysporum f. sp. albedinis]
MSSPHTDDTNWDPLGPSSAAGQALVILYPQNAAAKLAFSNVVDFLQEQDPISESIRSHYAKFIWYAEQQTSDVDVARLVHSQRDVSSSSPSSSNNSTLSPVDIWTGFYFLDPTIPPTNAFQGWAIGRLSRRHMALGQSVCDLLLTTSRTSLIARRHAFLSFSKETRMASVSLASGSLANVNNYPLTSVEKTAVCAHAENSIFFEDLRYSLDYTPYCYSNDGRKVLNTYLTRIHGDDQPTKEALLATPTPNRNSQTIGSYTITGANLIGMGSYGRVRPATGPNCAVVAIKTMEAKPDRLEFIQGKVDMVRFITTLLETSNQQNVLRCTEVMHMEGTNYHEFHMILQPFVDINLMRLPNVTHWTKLELILKDCLQGLAFLHAHNFVHTDIKPANIGLVNLQLSNASQEAIADPPLRRLTAVILDIDSIIPIPSGYTTIPAMPGTNGTIGFHSPEQESSEFDGRTDVWALGVCFFRAMYNRLPWFINQSGNPWNRKNPQRVQEQSRFHEKYTEAISQIQDDKHAGRDALRDFLTAAFRFSSACIRGQTDQRPSSADCLISLIQKSDFIRSRDAKEEGRRAQPVVVERLKRPAEN